MRVDIYRIGVYLCVLLALGTVFYDREPMGPGGFLALAALFVLAKFRREIVAMKRKIEVMEEVAKTRGIAE